MHVDEENWTRQELLKYFVNVYENPAEAHGMTHHELLDWVQNWANLLDAEREQERFKEMLRNYEDRYETTYLEDSKNGERMHYGYVNDPEDEGFLMVESDGSEKYTEVLGA